MQGLPGKRPHPRPRSAGSAAHPTAPQDLLFSVCGLTVFSTIICMLSAVVCCIQIFSLDIVHVVSASSGPGAAVPGWGGPWGASQVQIKAQDAHPSLDLRAGGLSSPFSPLPAAGPTALELCDIGMHVPT